MDDGWDASAAAWLAAQGPHGDWSRTHVLDAPMLARVDALRPADALDVGCGEGRFCRMLRARGIASVGIDPTVALLARARALDPGGDYRAGRAEALDVPDASYDLVVSYLSLIDIPDFRAAIGDMARVLRPGGALLVANLSSFVTAAPGVWERGADGARKHFVLDNYLEQRADWAEWAGIRIRNWHRPLSAYMAAFLDAGLVLRWFDEPAASGADPARAARHRRVPWFVTMEWRRP